jgi:hypothetical protein
MRTWDLHLPQATTEPARSGIADRLVWQDGQEKRIMVCLDAKVGRACIDVMPARP